MSVNGRKKGTNSISRVPNSKRRAAVSIGVFGAVVLTVLAVGCGPTRKEYAINEALLVDQTRTLEDQLYRAHFQIQRLESENGHLRERLAAKGEDVDPESASPASSAVPFEPNARPNTGQAVPFQTPSRADSHPDANLNLELPITQNRPSAGVPVRMAQAADHRRSLSPPPRQSSAVRGNRPTNPVPARIRNGKQNYAVRSAPPVSDPNAPSNSGPATGDSLMNRTPIQPSARTATIPSTDGPAYPISTGLPGYSR